MIRFRRALSIIFCAAALVVAAQAARAQEEPPPQMNDTVPIQVALMYDKLLGITPDFYQLMEKNPLIKNDPTRFGNDAVRHQQMITLQKTFQDMGPDTVFLVRKRVTITNVDQGKQLVTFSGLTDDEPFIFPLTDDEQYAVFFHNSKEVMSFAPPYAYDHFYLFGGWNAPGATFPAEIVVRPVAADKLPFPIDGGKSVKPVIADIVEITLLDVEGKGVAAVKRFKDWSPKGATVTPSLMDLKGTSLQNALPQQH